MPFSIEPHGGWLRMTRLCASPGGESDQRTFAARRPSTYACIVAVPSDLPCGVRYERSHVTSERLARPHAIGRTSALRLATAVGWFVQDVQRRVVWHYGHGLESSSLIVKMPTQRDIRDSGELRRTESLARVGRQRGRDGVAGSNPLHELVLCEGCATVTRHSRERKGCGWVFGTISATGSSVRPERVHRSGSRPSTCSQAARSDRSRWPCGTVSTRLAIPSSCLRCMMKWTTGAMSLVSTNGRPRNR